MSERYILTEAEEREARDKVALGAKALDDLRPGWFREVDIKTLDMTDGAKCVLGQLYDFYGNGLKELRWTDEVATAMGIYLCDGSEMMHREWIAKYAELQECWIGEISDRLVDELLDRF